MTEKTDLHPDDEIVTLSEDGSTAETKKKPTEEELKAAAKAKADADEDDDDSQEDERHAAGSGESAEESEARKKARAVQRRARKDHRRQREEEKDRTIAALTDRLAAVEGKVGTVEQASSTQTIALIDQRISDATQARDLATAAMEAAVTKQDGKAMGEAMKARDLAIDALRQLGDYKSRYEAHVKAQGQPGSGAQKAPDPALVNHANRFKADNQWVEFDPTKADDDSKKVHRLDAAVLRAGYDPTTPEYWEELQDRVDRAFPAKLAEAAEEDDEDAGASRRSNGQAKAANGSRRGPAMGGGRSNAQLGKNDIVIPKAVREAAEAAGYWKDPKDRADFINRWKASTKKYGAAT